MPIGASIGDQFGPALIVRQDSRLERPSDLAGKKVAVPGLQTSAYLAARQLIGDFTVVPMLFSDIGDAVMNRSVDAGILIHELQLNCEERGFKKLGDLGLLWDQKHHLPLPLGANAIKRSLGLDTILKVTALMRESIEVGLADRDATLKAALALSKADLDESRGDRYIAMYVNRRSLALDPDVQHAIHVLLSGGHRAGLCPGFDGATAYYE
jgi:1,4-dihydroxy-6-naphthoate synthase